MLTSNLVAVAGVVVLALLGLRLGLHELGLGDPEVRPAALVGVNLHRRHHLLGSSGVAGDDLDLAQDEPGLGDVEAVGRGVHIVFDCLARSLGLGLVGAGRLEVGAPGEEFGL